MGNKYVVPMIELQKLLHHGTMHTVIGRGTYEMKDATIDERLKISRTILFDTFDQV